MGLTVEGGNPLISWGTPKAKAICWACPDAHETKAWGANRIDRMLAIVPKIFPAAVWTKLPRTRRNMIKRNLNSTNFNFARQN